MFHQSHPSPFPLPPNYPSICGLGIKSMLTYSEPEAEAHPEILASATSIFHAGAYKRRVRLDDRVERLQPLRQAAKERVRLLSATCLCLV